ncbi:MAG: M16 family metallopeptidase [Hyphomicrobiaceae bacterium]
MTVLASFETTPAFAGPKATKFQLSNGMDVVVIPDNRAPVVTHMVWYRVGAADEPPTVSGIAHFLEHLMFKSTEKIAVGEFSKIISRMGGQDNAFTSQDVTAYFQRIEKSRLRDVMEMEADRMVNLRLTEKEVLTERDVILEERRSRIENSPSAIFQEQMDAALYYSHPYGTPVIGWQHEMETLSPKNALEFYAKYYAPNNAILVVSGDVTVDEVRKLANQTYGKLANNEAVGKNRWRPVEPPHRAARRIEVKDPRAGNPSLNRYYIAPSYLTSKPGEAEALDLLLKIMASGTTGRLYKKLVVEEKIASSAGGWYSGSGIDSGKIALYAVTNKIEDLAKVEASIDAVIVDIKANGVTDAELERAKNSYMAEYVYDNDSQSTLARRYGWGLSVGQTLEQIENWPQEIEKVTAEQVKKAAANLDILKSVTGTLLPLSPGDAASAPENSVAETKSRS